jgi:hypothetical protein
MRIARYLRHAATATLMAATTVAFAAEAPFNGLKPASPQPAATALQPGLAVNYFFMMHNKIDEVGRVGKAQKGTPILELNHKGGESDGVLTANRPMGVGAKMNGFIKFDKPGAYVFKINSNDGIRVSIGGTKIYEDPNVHPDTMSDPITVNIDQPGWYPLGIDYFQKKGTSALQVYLTPPGGEEEVVPASQYAHSKQ